MKRLGLVAPLLLVMAGCASPSPKPLPSYVTCPSYDPNGTWFGTTDGQGVRFPLHPALEEDLVDAIRGMQRAWRNLDEAQELRVLTDATGHRSVNGVMLGNGHLLYEDIRTTAWATFEIAESRFEVAFRPEVVGQQCTVADLELDPLPHWAVAY